MLWYKLLPFIKVESLVCITHLQIIFDETDALFFPIPLRQNVCCRNNLTYKMRKSNEKSIAIFWFN